jgi:hypothetical protein
MFKVEIRYYSGILTDVKVIRDNLISVHNTTHSQKEIPYEEVSHIPDLYTLNYPHTS